MISCRIFCSGNLYKCSHDIRNKTYVSSYLVAILSKHFRPGNNQWGSNASFIGPYFIFPVRCIANLCPRQSIRRMNPAVKLINLTCASETFFRIRFCTCPIIREKKYKSIVKLTFFFQIINQLSNVIIHAVNLGGINRHPQGRTITFCFRKLIPGTRFPFGQFPIRIDYTQFNHFPVTLFTNGFPSLVIFACKLFQILVFGM